MLQIPLFISGPEIAFIVLILVLVFGADKIPEIARGLGKGMRTLKDATNDIKTEITKSAEQHGIDSDLTSSLTKNVTKQVDAVKEEIHEITGAVKRNR